MSHSSWNWKGQTLWGMWVQMFHPRQSVVVYYQWLQRYEPIEDEL